MRILETIKPETAYIKELGGKRGGIFVMDVKASLDVPAFAEPFYPNFDANYKFRILMSPEDLQKAGLDELGKKWGNIRLANQSSGERERASLISLARLHPHVL